MTEQFNVGQFNVGQVNVGQVKRMSGQFNVGLVHERIAATEPDLEFFIFRDRRLTHEQFAERTRRFASFLHGRGLGCHTERADLDGHESGQDHLGHLPAQRQRVPRGDDRRLQGPRGAVQRQLPLRRGRAALPARRRRAPRRSSTTPSSRRRWPPSSPTCPELEVLIQVADESGNALLPGAVDYEEALGRQLARDAAGRAVARRPLHPLHRRHHRHAQGRAVAPARHLPRPAMGGRPFGTRKAVESYDEIAQRAARRPADRPQLMHPAAHARRRAVGVPPAS